ncbi:hypothetical protein OFC03_30650, partial [Escherichia coli]|nr:hypothetical protein [Escherichia coli]
ELLAEEEGEDADIDAKPLAAESDGKRVLQGEAVDLGVRRSDEGDHVLAWRDLSGDVGDVYEFVCDTAISSSLVDQFQLAAKQCQ